MEERVLTMTILHGLPASGKSTWARDHVDDRTIIVNVDGIRRSMTGTLSKWYSVGSRNDRETIAITAAHTIAETALRNNFSVIIDMQNLNGRTVAQWTRIAARHHANVVLVMFDAPLNDILTRNAERPEDDRVPEGYIRRQAERYGLGRSLVCGEVVRRFPA